MGENIISRPIVIAVVGSHYSGKSTLSNLLIEKCGFEAVKENWQNDPYKNNRDDSGDYLRSQYWFFLQTAKAMIEGEKLKKEGKSVVLDTFLPSSLNFAETKLNKVDFKVYEEIVDMVLDRLPLPDLVVYLKAPTTYLYEVNRLRRVEAGTGPKSDSSVGFDWLDQVVKLNEKRFGSWQRTPIAEVNVDKLDVTDDKVFSELLSSINARLR